MGGGSTSRPCDNFFPLFHYLRRGQEPILLPDFPEGQAVFDPEYAPSQSSLRSSPYLWIASESDWRTGNPTIVFIVLKMRFVTCRKGRHAARVRVWGAPVRSRSGFWQRGTAAFGGGRFGSNPLGLNLATRSNAPNKPASATYLELTAGGENAYRDGQVEA